MRPSSATPRAPERSTAKSRPAPMTPPRSPAVATEPKPAPPRLGSGAATAGPILGVVEPALFASEGADGLSGLPVKVVEPEGLVALEAGPVLVASGESEIRFAFRSMIGPSVISAFCGVDCGPLAAAPVFGASLRIDDAPLAAGPAPMGPEPAGFTGSDFAGSGLDRSGLGPPALPASKLDAADFGGSDLTGSAFGASAFTGLDGDVPAFAASGFWSAGFTSAGLPSEGLATVDTGVVPATGVSALAGWDGDPTGGTIGFASPELAEPGFEEPGFVEPGLAAAGFVEAALVEPGIGVPGLPISGFPVSGLLVSGLPVSGLGPFAPVGVPGPFPSLLGGFTGFLLPSRLSSAAFRNLARSALRLPPCGHSLSFVLAPRPPPRRDRLSES